MQGKNEKGVSAGSRIAKAAGTVMVAFVISNLIGLFAKTLTARTFGTGIESSAFFAANRFSEILFNLVAGGALGSAFIPVFSGLLVDEKRGQAWRLASAIANLVSIVLLVLSLLTMIFSRQVVNYILAPGFSQAEEILTARLLRVQIISSVVFGLSGLIMGILNAHQHFLLPALAPALYQVGWIVGIYFLEPAMGIFGLAWGVVLGSFLHLIIQLPLLINLPERAYHPTMGLNIPQVRVVGRLMAPRMLGVAIVQLNFLLNTILASFQPEGSITAIGLAFPLMIMPEAAIAQSIAIAALPTFSEQVARNKLAEMRGALAGSLQAALLLSVPAMVGLIILREPIVRILYEGSQFGPESTQLVAWALLWYALGLVSHSLVEIISRAFYALHDTKTPVLIGIGAMSLNLVFSILFSALFKRIGWQPHGGLALANTFATTLEALLLIWLMRRRLDGLAGKRTLTVLWKAIIAGSVMGVIVWFISTQLIGFGELVPLAAAILVGAGVYFLVLRFLGISEIQTVVAMVLRKILPGQKKR